jgi:hypothetical protein
MFVVVVLGLGSKNRSRQTIGEAALARKAAGRAGASYCSFAIAQAACLSTAFKYNEQRKGKFDVAQAYRYI